MEFSISRSTMLLTIFLPLIGFMLYKIIVWLLHYIYKYTVMKKIKGLPNLPFIGSALHIKQGPEFLKQYSEMSKIHKDEPFFSVWFGTHVGLMFHNPDYVEFLLNSDKHDQKSFLYNFFKPWLGDGMFLSYGDSYLKKRRIVNEVFSFEKMNDYLPIMNEQAEILIEKLTKLSLKKKPINILHHLCLYTLDVICESGLGMQTNFQNEMESEYLKSLEKITDFVFLRMHNPFHWSDTIYRFSRNGREQKRCIDIVNNFSLEIILQRETELVANNFSKTNKRHSVIESFLKEKYSDNNTMTVKAIQEEVNSFIFAGHDTTGVANSWACQLIGSHPEVQKKLHEEIDRVLGGINRSLNRDDLKDLEYLERVHKEVLRLYPSAPIIARKFTEDEQIGKYKILKGETAAVLIYEIHRCEKYYPDPEKFDPDRFLPENCKNRPAYAYMPFSAGRRTCIGQRFAQMEDKVVLANILRKFEIKALKTIEELKPHIETVIRPSTDMLIELKLRN